MSMRKGCRPFALSRFCIRVSRRKTAGVIALRSRHAAPLGIVRGAPLGTKAVSHSLRASSSELLSLFCDTPYSLAISVTRIGSWLMVPSASARAAIGANLRPCFRFLMASCLDRSRSATSCADAGSPTPVSRAVAAALFAAATTGSSLMTAVLSLCSHSLRMAGQSQSACRSLLRAT